MKYLTAIYDSKLMSLIFTLVFKKKRKKFTKKKLSNFKCFNKNERKKTIILRVSGGLCESNKIPDTTNSWTISNEKSHKETYLNLNF